VSNAPRRLPSDHDMESMVLGAMMAYGDDAVPAALDILRSEDVDSGENREMFRAIAALYTDGRPTDPVSVAHELERRGALDRVVPRLHINECLSFASASSSVRYYAELLADKAAHRRLIRAGQEIVELGHDEAAHGQAQLDKAIELLVRSAPHDSDGPAAIGDAIEDWASEIKAMQRGEGLTLGYKCLDEIVRGGEGQVVVLAGLPGLAKTTVGLNMVWHQACREIKTAVVSLEMTKEAVAERFLQIEGNCSSDDLLYNPTQTKKLISKLCGRPIQILAMGDRSAGAIIRQMRLLYNQGVRSFFVDYLQLISHPAERRDLEIGEALRMLLEFAKRYKTCVITASQVNRDAVTHGADGRPALWQMKESSAIESHADLVLGLSRSAYTTGDEAAFDLVMEVLKNRRRGCVGRKLPFFFNPKLQRIEERTGVS
jgi:replicative DNA helicase